MDDQQHRASAAHSTSTELKSDSIIYKILVRGKSDGGLQRYHMCPDRRLSNGSAHQALIAQTESSNASASPLEANLVGSDERAHSVYSRAFFSVVWKFVLLLSFLRGQSGLEAAALLIWERYSDCRRGALNYPEEYNCIWNQLINNIELPGITEDLAGTNSVLPHRGTETRAGLRE